MVAVHEAVTVLRLDRSETMTLRTALKQTVDETAVSSFTGTLRYSYAVHAVAIAYTT